MSRFERRGSQNESVWAVYHEVSGRKLGTVRKQLDGTWLALRGHGPSAYLVHSGGHRTRKEAAEALR